MSAKKYVKRSASERQAYHFKLSKKHAEGLNHKTGQFYELSDFQRGVHLGKAQSILKQRMNSAKYFKRKKGKEYKKIFN